MLTFRALSGRAFWFPLGGIEILPINLVLFLMSCVHMIWKHTILSGHTFSEQVA